MMEIFEFFYRSHIYSLVGISYSVFSKFLGIFTEHVFFGSFIDLTKPQSGPFLHVLLFDDCRIAFPCFANAE